MAEHAVTQRKVYRRPVSVLFTDQQRQALRRLERRRGLKASAYLRSLAIADLERAGFYRTDDDPALGVDDDEDRDD